MNFASQPWAWKHEEFPRETQNVAVMGKEDACPSWFKLGTRSTWWWQSVGAQHVPPPKTTRKEPWKWIKNSHFSLFSSSWLRHAHKGAVSGNHKKKHGCSSCFFQVDKNTDALNQPRKRAGTLWKTLYRGEADKITSAGSAWSYSRLHSITLGWTSPELISAHTAELSECTEHRETRRKIRKKWLH